MPILNEKGSLLIGAIIAITMISVLAVGAVYLKSTSTMGEVLENNQAQAYYLAESGGRYGALKLRRTWTPVRYNNYTFALNDGAENHKFVLKIMTTSAPYTKFESTGIVHPGKSTEGRRTLTFEVYSSTGSKTGRRFCCNSN